eukprot:3106251-Prymnesium_polylepis.1
MAALRRVPNSHIITAVEEVDHRQVSVAAYRVTNDRNVPTCQQAPGFVDRKTCESGLDAVIRALRVDLDLGPNISCPHPSKTGSRPSSGVDTVSVPSTSVVAEPILRARSACANG